MGLLDQTMLQQPQLANVFVQVFLRHSKTLAVNTTGLEETVCLVHEYGVIDRDGELDVAGMAGASRLVQVASGTSGQGSCERMHTIAPRSEKTYGASPQEPRAGS